MAIAEPQSLNRYSYTHSDPVNFIDPSGLDCFGYFATLVFPVNLSAIIAPGYVAD